MLRPRLRFDTWPAVVYAIGDIHGCLDELADIEQQIVADAASIPGEKWIVTLGDYIDRGPDSAGVIDYLTAPPPEGFRRFSLMGNHEEIALGFLADPPSHAYWLEEGGIETLLSYGVDLETRHRPEDVERRLREDLGNHIPPGHLGFLHGLAAMLTLPGWAFVHAGIRPGIRLEDQRDEDLLWIRQPFLSAELQPGLRVVHGHTPGLEPVVTTSRICIDTKCFATGILTALRISPDGQTKFLSTRD
jgi:serine/threonine protein phosphatase 1